MDTFNIAIQLAALIVLLALSAFFSSAETAFSTVNEIQMQLMSEDGSKRAGRVMKILRRKGEMLSTILIGNNIVNISASALTTSLTIDVLGNRFIGVMTGVLTLFVLVFGEIFPKSLASIYSNSIALHYSSVIWPLICIFKPVNFVLEKFRLAILSRFGVDDSTKLDTMTEEEFKTLTDVGHEEGAIENDEYEMIHNVLDLDESLARDIMIPLPDMVFVSLDASREELLELYRKYNYTRYPVYHDDKDTVIGVVNIKDLLSFPDDEEFHINKLMRDPHFTFEHKEIGTLLIEMRKEAIGLIIVLDEYGATSGMITMEDILEEIVGEIRDEYDEDERDSIVTLKKNREYLVNGTTNIDDVNDETGLKLASDLYDSIGGYIIERLDRLPKRGEQLRLDDGTRLIAEVVRKNRIEKVHIIKSADPD